MTLTPRRFGGTTRRDKNSPHDASITLSPLYDLFKKGAGWNWTLKCSQVFEQIKKMKKMSLRQSFILFLCHKTICIGFVLFCFCSYWLMYSTDLTWLWQLNLQVMQGQNPDFKKDNLKTILLWNDFFNSKHFGFGVGREPFINAGCPVTNCTIVDRSDGYLPLPIEDFNAIWFHMVDSSGVHFPLKRNKHQSGADYKTLAPPLSYIDVSDFSSLMELSEYLKHLDNTPEEYINSGLPNIQKNFARHFVFPRRQYVTSTRDGTSHHLSPCTSHCSDLRYTNARLASPLAGHAGPLTDHSAPLPDTPVHSIVQPQLGTVASLDIADRMSQHSPSMSQWVFPADSYLAPVWRLDKTNRNRNRSRS
uniref:Fucosyltransferase n=1 Tax=Timema bartmani TaxID=61472 RepID=A0A7R9I0P1_9NEOP|nr:unnamed protein product [Timema bartmani]